MERRGSTGVWALIIGLMVITGAFGWMQLSELPDLDMLVGPDLTVRHVAVERETNQEAPMFERGDRLTHLEGISLESLRELGDLLPPIIEDADAPDAGAEPPEFEDGEQGEVGEFDEDVAVLDYQLVRPVYRFTLALQEESVEPGELPPGVEPGDRLVEVDGRMLPGTVGTEGIRSVTASRPDAVLGIERPDAVFSGQMTVDRQSYYPGVLLTFLVVLVVLGVVWRFHSNTIGTRAAYCIGLETVCLGWLAFLVFGFQWVLADPWLAIGVIAGLVMIRPLSMYAREQGNADESRGGFVALVLGASVVVLLGMLLMVGYLPSNEEALHGAGIAAGLFIIYELVVGSMEGRSLLSLGEQSGYLAGIVVLGLFVVVVTFLIEPVAFREEGWRWFAVSIPALLWFGDVLYAVKYGAQSAMGDVAERDSRDQLIAQYLQDMALEMPHTDLRLVGTVEGRAVEFRKGLEGLEKGPAEEALADAVDIMITEKARVPLPAGADRQSHPMEGIAKAMDMSLGLVLAPPPGSLQLNGEEIEVALVGMRESSEADVPSYASSETLDRAQEMWTGPVASAVLIEIASELSTSAAPVESGQTSAPARKDLEEVRDEIEELEEQRQEAARERDQLETRLDETRRVVRLRELTRPVDYPATVDQIRSGLLEDQLIETLEYLLEDREPVALAGAPASGKGFAAWSAHHIEDREGDLVVVDADEPGADDRFDEILGEEGGGSGPGLLGGFGGSLLVRGAQRCEDGRLLALCHQCDEKGVRLYLSFAAADAHQRSVLEDRPATLEDLLGHREVVIPRFVQRTTVQRPILEFWLGEWSRRYDRRIEGFSRMAAEALEAYDYPGEIAEAVEVVRLAVLETEHDVVDLENLPARVRQTSSHL